MAATTLLRTNYLDLVRGGFGSNNPAPVALHSRYRGVSLKKRPINSASSARPCLVTRITRVFYGEACEPMFS